MLFKKQLLFFILFIIANCIYAQLDNTREGFNIKPSDSLLNGEKSFTFKIHLFQTFHKFILDILFTAACFFIFFQSLKKDIIKSIVIQMLVIILMECIVKNRGPFKQIYTKWISNLIHVLHLVHHHRLLHSPHHLPVIQQKEIHIISHQMYMKILSVENRLTDRHSFEQQKQRFEEQRLQCLGFV